MTSVALGLGVASAVSVLVVADVWVSSLLAVAGLLVAVGDEGDG